jgi:hypothetical protein
MKPGVKTKNPLGYYMSKNLMANLTYYKNTVINRDRDSFGVIDGGEGLGKSTIAQQVAKFLDIENKLTMTQIVFDMESFKKAVIELPPRTAIIYDEARFSLASKRAMTTAVMELEQFMTECRQFNKFVILVLNSFYDLSRYGGVFRTKWLIHCYEKANHERLEFDIGFFSFYNEANKKAMYTSEKLRNGLLYPHTMASFTDRFPEGYLVDEQAYRDMKREATMRAAQKRVKPMKAAYDSFPEGASLPTVQQPQHLLTKQRGTLSDLSFRLRRTRRK